MKFHLSPHFENIINKKRSNQNVEYGGCTVLKIHILCGKMLHLDCS